MLPYFKYGRDGAPKGEEIDHNNFAVNAKNALSYYKNQMETGVYDQVFMIGDPEKIERGKYSIEGRDQLNMPHAFELFAAAQAKEFFELPPVAGAYNDTKWFADPLELKGNKFEDLTWTDKNNGAALRSSLENFIMFNHYFSMYIVPALFKFAGMNGSRTQFSPQTYTTHENLDPWIYTGLAEFNIESFLFFFRRRKVFHKWETGLPVEECFESLFEYLTNSAKWYFGLLYSYNDASKLCWDCKEGNCGGNFTGQLFSCLKSAVLLPQLFGEEGAKMIAKRAALPYWLSKGGSSSFQTQAGNIVNDVSIQAIKARTEDPREVTTGFASLDLDDIADKTSLFQKLVKDVYNIVAELERLTD